MIERLYDLRWIEKHVEEIPEENEDEIIDDSVPDQKEK
jgi:hypothetical protein